MNAEQKLEMIEHCKLRIKVLQTYWHVNAEDMSLAKLDLEVYEIALAALTVQPVKVDDSMALAFHKALSDGGVGHEDLEEIKVGLEAALCNIPRHAPAADLAELVPDERTFEDYCTQNPEMTMGDGMIRAAEWNSCRAAILRNIEETK